MRVSAPIPTLDLPCLTLENPVEQLGIVAGGTGIAPAIQILSEVADSGGSMGKCQSALLLYSSRTSRDVLMLDELRELTSKSRRVKVAHTLTQEGHRASGRHFRGKHRHFATTYAPKDGPLRPEEVPYRGRVDTDMLKALPGPGGTTCVVVCGPQGLLDASEKCLIALGHQKDHILLLRATATESQYPDFSEESEASGSEGEVSQDELASLPSLPSPGISVSPPEIIISGPESASKAGDLLRAQLGGPGGLTFADRVRQARDDAPQKEA